jgi:hypothetical protein
MPGGEQTVFHAALTGFTVSLPYIMATSFRLVRVAMAAIWASGWMIVVSGGDTQPDIGRSSKPTTLRSSGMRSRCSLAAS